MVSSVWRYEPLNPVCALCLIGFRFLSHPFRILFSPVPHSFLMRLASFLSVSFISFTMVKRVSHHDETCVSSWWNLCLITMKLTLYTCVNDAQHVRKECGTRVRGMGNGWERNGEHVRKNAETSEQWFANRSNVDVLPLKQTLFDRTVTVSCNINWFYYHPLVNLLES